MSVESAERRAERKLLAKLYASMPSRETFEAATRYEQTRMQAAQINDNGIYQMASLLTGIAANLPPTEEKNRALSQKARDFLDRYLDEANLRLSEYIAQSQEARQARETEDEEPEEEPGDAGPIAV